MVKITTRKPARKVGKPQADFPLFVHARGYWAEKVRGRLDYPRPNTSVLRRCSL